MTKTEAQPKGAFWTERGARWPWAVARPDSTDPYMHTLEHTARQVMVSLLDVRGRSGRSATTEGRSASVAFGIGHPPEYPVGQAFQPDVARFTVRLESLTYSSFDILAGGCLESIPVHVAPTIAAGKPPPPIALNCT